MNATHPEAVFALDKSSDGDAHMLYELSSRDDWNECKFPDDATVIVSRNDAYREYLAMPIAGGAIRRRYILDKFSCADSENCDDCLRLELVWNLDSAPTDSPTTSPTRVETSTPTNTPPPPMSPPDSYTYVNVLDHCEELGRYRYDGASEGFVVSWVPLMCADLTRHEVYAGTFILNETIDCVDIADESVVVHDQESVAHATLHLSNSTVNATSQCFTCRRSDRFCGGATVILEWTV